MSSNDKGKYGPGERPKGGWGNSDWFDRQDWDNKPGGQPKNLRSFLGLKYFIYAYKIALFMLEQRDSMLLGKTEPKYFTKDYLVGRIESDLKARFTEWDVAAIISTTKKIVFWGYDHVVINNPGEGYRIALDVKEALAQLHKSKRLSTAHANVSMRQLISTLKSKTGDPKVKEIRAMLVKSNRILQATLKGTHWLDFIAAAYLRDMVGPAASFRTPADDAKIMMEENFYTDLHERLHKAYADMQRELDDILGGKK